MSPFKAALVLAFVLTLSTSASGSAQATPEPPGAADAQAAFRAYEAQDYPRALELAQRAGDHWLAQQILGHMYMWGAGVEKDEARGAAHYQRADQAGDAYSTYLLGRAYDAGAGVPADSAKAFELVARAADAGIAVAMRSVGYYHEMGLGTTPNDSLALFWYRRAAERNENVAMSNLGVHYLAGRLGLPQSVRAARLWSLRAAMHGNKTDRFVTLKDQDTGPLPLALNLIQQVYAIPGSARRDFERADEAFALYMKAAELGHPLAINAIVNAYQQGTGVEKDMTKARYWAQIGAEFGDAWAQTVLAQYYADGIGGPADVLAARFWLEQAALQKNTLAMFLLAEMYDGKGELPRNEALAIHWYTAAHREGSAKAQAVLDARGLLRPAPEAQAFIDRIHAQGPDRSSVHTFAVDVATYCKYGGPRCHELSVAAREFQDGHNSAVSAAEWQRLWNVYSPSDPSAAQASAERSECLRRTTAALQRFTYGQQDWYLADTCR